jgi:hypothetical protein
LLQGSIWAFLQRNTQVGRNLPPPDDPEKTSFSLFRFLPLVSAVRTTETGEIREGGVSHAQFSCFSHSSQIDISRTICATTGCVLLPQYGCHLLALLSLWPSGSLWNEEHSVDPSLRGELVKKSELDHLMAAEAAQPRSLPSVWLHRKPSAN